MALPAVQTMAKEDEVVMTDWMENFRPVRQRTVRSETTKDKAGSLPPAVYSLVSHAAVICLVTQRSSPLVGS